MSSFLENPDRSASLASDRGWHTAAPERIQHNCAFSLLERLSAEQVGGIDSASTPAGPVVLNRFIHLRGSRRGLPVLRSATEGGKSALLRTSFHKYDHVCCAAFGFWRGATREHSRQRSVTEEQQSQKPNATQPSGRRFFLAQTSLLAPYRPLKGMRVARASSGPKIPRRKRGRIYETGYLVWSQQLFSCWASWVCSGSGSGPKVTEHVKPSSFSGPRRSSCGWNSRERRTGWPRI